MGCTVLFCFLLFLFVSEYRYNRDVSTLADKSVELEMPSACVCMSVWLFVFLYSLICVCPLSVSFFLTYLLYNLMFPSFGPGGSVYPAAS